jgi:hypothetical protein
VGGVKALAVTGAVVAFCVFAGRAVGEHEKWAHHTASYWHWRWKHAHHRAVVAQHRLHRLRQIHRRSIVVRWPDTLHAIALAAVTYGISMNDMVRVAQCESGLDPGLAPNSATATGLFQFLVPSTWSRTPYARFSPYDAVANALAAAWLVKEDGGWREWTCQP